MLLWARANMLHCDMMLGQMHNVLRTVCVQTHHMHSAPYHGCFHCERSLQWAQGVKCPARTATRQTRRTVRAYRPNFVETSSVHGA